MELYSVNKIVYYNDIWMDETGDISIVEEIDCMNETGDNSVRIRVLTGSSAGQTFYEDEWKFEDPSAGVGQDQICDEVPYFNCLVFRPLTGYQNTNMIEHIAKEQHGLQI